MSNPIEVPNGGPQAAVMIHISPHPQGQQVHVTHNLSGGWPATVELLITALKIAHAKEQQERAAQEPKPLITPATLLPRFRPEVG